MSETPSSTPETPYTRLNVSLTPPAAEVLRTAKTLEQLSLTEIVRRAIATYDFGLQAEFSGDHIVAINDFETRHIAIPNEPPDEGPPEQPRLRVNINTECDRSLTMIETLTGLDRDTNVNIAILYYGEIAGAHFAGYRIKRASGSNY
jgi:hypothetical protein